MGSNKDLATDEHGYTRIKPKHLYQNMSIILYLR